MTAGTTPTCPRCSSPCLAAYDSCHTWGGNAEGKGWMSCIGCYSALRLVCDECDWQYEWGLNRLNPRSALNETNRPSWLEGTFNEALPAGWSYREGSYAGRPNNSWEAASRPHEHRINRDGDECVVCWDWWSHEQQSFVHS